MLALQVIKLRAVWQFAALLLTYRLGVLVAETAFSLKLIDKGVPKETLSALALFQVCVNVCVFMCVWLPVSQANTQLLLQARRRGALFNINCTRVHTQTVPSGASDCSRCRALGSQLHALWPIHRGLWSALSGACWMGTEAR